MPNLDTDHSVSRIELFHDWRYGVIMSEAEQLPVDLAAEETQLPPRDRLIDSAKKLFCRYGINSVGVDAIIEQAGTAKTTLYKLFGSKDGLVEAVLEQEGRSWRSWFLTAIDGPGGPFINAVGEFDKTDNRMRTLAIAHKTVVIERLSALCAEAKVPEPEQAAHTIGLIMDGAIVMALITRDPSAADIAARACAAVIPR
jgi:AcrR family transcriptional regulator